MRFMSSKEAFQMPRGVRKKAHELTGDEAMAKLFSKTVVRHLKKAANPDEQKGKKSIDGE
jgi:hypothetical protein